MFGFPAQNKPDGFHFAQNLLQSATFQVRYTSITSVFDETGKLIDALTPILPVVRQLQRSSSGWKEVGEKTPLLNDQSKKALRFANEDNTKSFSVSEDSFTLTIAGPVYTSFAEAQNIFYEIIELVGSIINVSSFTRVAVRKINSVDAQPDEAFSKDNNPWPEVLTDVFNSQLLSHTIGIPAAEKLVSTVVNNRFIDGNNILSLIYGLSPREIENNTRQVILDIDLISKGDYKSLVEIKNILPELNKEVFNIFAWSISPTFMEFINRTA